MAGTHLPTESGEHPEERSHGFLHIPEVQCKVALQGACDDRTLFEKGYGYCSERKNPIVFCDDRGHVRSPEVKTKNLVNKISQVLESRERRDANNKKWRKALLEIWKLTNQEKKIQNKENMDLGQLDKKKKQVSVLLSEVEVTHSSYQGCLDNYRKSFPTPEASICSMSKSFWFPRIQVQMNSSPLCSTELDFKLSGSEVGTFSYATVEYIQKNFMPINQAHRVPPLLFFNDEYKRGTKRDKGRNRQRLVNCRIGQLSYYSDECLSTHPQLADQILADLNQTPGDVKNIKDERRGIEAVELVGDKLIECHQSLPGGMFVISNLKHQKYLGNFMKTMKNSEGLKMMVTAEDGDHDIFVIHRKIGIILIQVKGCTSFSATKTKKVMVQDALKQVMKDKFVFYESNRDLDFVLDGKLPVYGFAAVPFLQTSDVESLGICKNHSHKILTESALKNLHEWLKERVSIPVRDEDFALSEDEYMLMCGRYAGLLSEIPMRTFKEGNEKLGEKIEFLFLTPDQMALVNETKERFLCVCGDYGTGKSLVLVEKAKKLVEEDDSSIALVISCSDIDNYYLCKLNKPYKSAEQLVERFISVIKNCDIFDRIRVMQFGDVLQDFSDGKCDKVTTISAELFHKVVTGYVKKQKVKGKCHVFLDEVLLGLFLEEPYVFSKAGSRWENINAELPEGSFCWVSVCPHSYKMMETEKPSRIVPSLPRIFKWCYLNLIMRIPQSVCDLVKGIEDFVGHGHCSYSYVGHTFKGPKPLLVTLPNCSCPKSDVILCQACGGARLESSLKKIKERFDFTVLPVVIVMFMFHCGDYLLPLYQKFQKVLQDAFSKFDVKLEWNTMYGSQIENPYGGKATISVVDQHTFIGCESRNVMCIDMFGMHQWFYHDSSEWFHLIVNRCTAQYIHINWPEVEARIQWLSFLQGYEIYCRELDSSSWDTVVTILTLARGSKGLCVKSLREKKLFEEIQ